MKEFFFTKGRDSSVFIICNLLSNYGPFIPLDPELLCWDRYSIDSTTERSPSPNMSIKGFCRFEDDRLASSGGVFNVYVQSGFR